jgi:hypothetical protein
MKKKERRDIKDRRWGTHFATDGQTSPTANHSRRRRPHKKTTDFHPCEHSYAGEVERVLIVNFIGVRHLRVSAWRAPESFESKSEIFYDFKNRAKERGELNKHTRCDTTVLYAHDFFLFHHT